MKKIVLICFILLTSGCSRNKFETELKKRSIPVTFDNFFELKSLSEDPFIIIGENSEKGIVIKINVREIKNDVDSAVKKNLQQILSQYQFSMAPYPGQLTTALTCGSAKHPQLTEEHGLSILNTFANERLALSICDEDDFVFKVKTAYFQTSDNKLLIVDLYQKKDDQSKISQQVLGVNFKELKFVSLKPFSPILKKN